MNMILDEVMKNIESVSFRFVINQADGTAMFKRLLKEQYSFVVLTQLLDSDKEAVEIIVGRLLEIAALPIDERYANPNDTTLAAYLYVIDPHRANELIPTIIEVPNLWWTIRIIKEIQDNL